MHAVALSSNPVTYKQYHNMYNIIIACICQLNSRTGLLHSASWFQSVALLCHLASIRRSKDLIFNTLLCYININYAISSVIHCVTSFLLLCQCDGDEYTSQIRSLRLEAICFLNITSYGAGTNPWGTPSSRDVINQSLFNIGTAVNVVRGESPHQVLQLISHSPISCLLKITVQIFGIALYQEYIRQRREYPTLVCLSVNTFYRVQSAPAYKLIYHNKMLLQLLHTSMSGDLSTL